MPLNIVKKANSPQTKENNDKTAVITILGIQGQKDNIKTEGCARYYFADESADKSQEFFNTLPLLADKFGAENIMPIYTAEAREFNEAVMTHYSDFQINFNDSYKIVDEKNFEALFEIFERVIDDLVKSGVGRIVFDVTHGFRHLPLLALVDLLIQNFSNRSNLICKRDRKVQAIRDNRSKTIPRYRQYRFCDRSFFSKLYFGAAYKNKEI